MSFLGIVKTISFIATIGFGIALVVLYTRFSELKKQKEAEWKEHFNLGNNKKNENPHQQEWNRIVEMFRSQNPSDWRLAILDADMLLEKMINSLGYQGETFADKLKSIHPADHPWLQNAWDVHLLRNRLAHESGVQLDQRQIYNAFKTYESIFYTTGFLR